MKKNSNWLLVLCIAASLGALFLYVDRDRKNTDTQPPEILMESEEISVSVYRPGELLLQGVTAVDDRDGDISDKVVIEQVYGVDDQGRATVTYAVADSSGNVSKARRTVYFPDYESPRLTLSQPLLFKAGTVVNVLDLLKAEDVMDGDISHRLKATIVSRGTSLSAEGVHEVMFRVTNSLGDTTSLTLPVETYPADRYNAALTLREYLVYLPKGVSFSPESYLLSFEAAGEEFDLRRRVPEELVLQVESDVDTDTPGVYSVCYTVNQTGQTKDYVGYSRLIVVVEG